MPKIIEGSGSELGGIIRQLKVSSIIFRATGLMPALRGNQDFEKIPFFCSSGMAESLELVLASEERFSGFSSSSVLTECDLNLDGRFSVFDEVEPSAFSGMVLSSTVGVTGGGGSCLLKKSVIFSCSPGSNLKLFNCSSDRNVSISSFSSE